MKIRDLGREIGYHYEDLFTARGNFDKAIENFARNLSGLRELAPVSTISMHGRPLSPYDNRLLWDVYDPGSFEPLGEVVYRDIDYTGTHYLTDTGRSWAAGSANLRDKAVGSLEVPATVCSTDSLIEFIRGNELGRFVLTSHPERWADSPLELRATQLRETCKLTLKRMYLALRKRLTVSAS